MRCRSYAGDSDDSALPRCAGPHRPAGAGQHVRAGRPSCAAHASGTRRSRRTRTPHRRRHRWACARCASRHTNMARRRNAWTPRSLLALRELQVDQVVVPEERLVPIDRKLTLAQPFTLERRRRARGDGGHGRHRAGRAFPSESDQVLAAQHLLADLAQLWLDTPQQERAVIAVAPPDVAAHARVPRGAARRARGQPDVRGTTLDTAFRSVEAGHGHGGPAARARPRAARATSAARRDADPVDRVAVDGIAGDVRCRRPWRGVARAPAARRRVIRPRRNAPRAYIDELDDAVRCRTGAGASCLESTRSPSRHAKARSRSPCSTGPTGR